MRALRQVPPALVAGLAIGLVSSAAVLWRLGTGHEDFSSTRQLIHSGCDLASIVLALFGARELAAQTTGRVARGVRIAAMGFALDLVLVLAWLIVAFVNVGHHVSLEMYRDIAVPMSLVGLGAMLLVACGLGLASRHRDLWVIGAILALVAELPWFATRWIAGATGISRTGMLAQDGARLALFVVLVVCAALASRERAATEDPPRAAAGLRLASRMLWLRLLAVLAVAIPAVLLVMAADHWEHAGATTLVTDMALAAGLVQVVALGGFALGALAAARGRIGGLAGWLLVAGAAASLWCAGVVLQQLPWLYAALTHRLHMMSDIGAQTALTLTTTAQPVGLVSILCVLLGIAMFAKQHLAELRDRAGLRAAAFGLFAACGLGAAHASGDHALTWLVVAAGATLWAIQLAAQLCSDAANAMASDVALPAARVIGGGGST